MGGGKGGKIIFPHEEEVLVGGGVEGELAKTVCREGSSLPFHVNSS